MPDRIGIWKKLRDKVDTLKMGEEIAIESLFKFCALRLKRVQNPNTGSFHDQPYIFLKASLPHKNDFFKEEKSN